MTPERAASIIGDLMEFDPAGGSFRFWCAIGRTFVSNVWSGWNANPLRMVGGGAFAWFCYLLLSVILTFCLNTALTMVWGIGYFLTHHTVLEIMARLARLRLDWPPPSLPELWIANFAWWVWAPFEIGRSAARSWRGKELAVGLGLMVLWTPLGILTRAHLPLVPVVQTSALLGALWVRRQSSRIRTV